jgi:hypothetical protein
VQHLRGRGEREPVVGLIPVQDALELEDPIHILTLFDAQKLAMYPFAVNLGGGRLVGSKHDVTGLLLVGGVRTDGSRQYNRFRSLETCLHQVAPLARGRAAPAFNWLPPQASGGI